MNKNDISKKNGKESEIDLVVKRLYELLEESIILNEQYKKKLEEFDQVLMLYDALDPEHHHILALTNSFEGDQNAD